uniref:Uncharacterized protein n=1 Tax=Kalanchoe fedtschenkoi TaxID=63787 RepID=A0A7N0T4I6_KALFE
MRRFPTRSYRQLVPAPTADTPAAAPPTIPATPAPSPSLSSPPAPPADAPSFSADAPAPTTLNDESGAEKLAVTLGMGCAAAAVFGFFM